MAVSNETIDEIRTYLKCGEADLHLLVEFVAIVETRQIVSYFVDVVQELCRDGVDPERVADRIVHLFGHDLAEARLPVPHHRRLAVYHAVAFMVKETNTPVLLPDYLPPRDTTPMWLRQVW